jgi:hypothetical protein
LDAWQVWERAGVAKIDCAELEDGWLGDRVYFVNFRDCLRSWRQQCIVESKMIIRSSRFSFIFRYWYTVAASAE